MTLNSPKTKLEVWNFESVIYRTGKDHPVNTLIVEEGAVCKLGEDCF